MKQREIQNPLLRRSLGILLSAALAGTSITGCGANPNNSNPVSETVTLENTQAGSIDNASDTAPSEEAAASQAVDEDSTPAENESSEAPLYPLPTAAEDAGIYIEAIPELSDNFIRGMDVSSILAEEKSGVKYYNAAGEEQDVFQTMAEAGINYARIRVWNDPFDKDGNGYGGGNNDVATAIALGKRATEQGMKVCIDFHYSDFWADPKKQMVPKAWEGMTMEEKSAALYDFTKDSLTQMLDAGVNVCMVQVGNETNNGMAGETLLPNIAQLMNAGSKAIRELSAQYGKDIKVALHYTDASDFEKLDSIMYKLSSFQVDYDIFALSYYPYWHGTFDNLKKVMENIQDKYGKETLIAEIAYCYTAEDTDGSGNSVGADDLIDAYAATVQSQATALRDVCATANEAGALGVFYWEGAWITVGDVNSDNSPIWEEFGSGWASSYSAAYDPEDAGKYYGGCSWDNQALFDAQGKPLESLNTFKWLKYGTNAELAIDFVPVTNIELNVGGEVTLPDALNVVYNDRSVTKTAPVTWNENDVKAIDTSTAGKYTLNGTLDDGTAVTCNITVDKLNYVKNASFEDSDTSMWTVAYEGDKNPTDFQEKNADAHTGDYSFHFWSESDMNFSIEQEITDLENGTYDLKAFFQGGDISSDAKMELYAVVNGEEKTASFTAQGYANWQDPTISGISVTDGTLKVGVRIQCGAKGWGTIDDFTLNSAQ